MHNNKIAYLINNQIGALSRKVNGLKGDKVSIITYSLNMRLVKNEAGHIFWVNVNNLSEAPISKDTTNEQTYTDTKGRKKRV